MANNDLPNGFTGYSQKKPQGFQSAADAIRRNANPSIPLGSRSAFSGASPYSADQRTRIAPSAGPKGSSGAKGGLGANLLASLPVRESGSALVNVGEHLVAQQKASAAPNDQADVADAGRESASFVASSPASPIAMPRIPRPAPRPQGSSGILSYADDELSPDGALMFDPAKLASIPEMDRRWSWVEVDLNAIRHNVTVARRSLTKGAHLCAVVKADGYGHGAVACARTALSAGADYLAVATVDEGIQLRENSVFAPVLLLSQPPIEAIPLLLAYKIMPSVYDPQFAIAYAEAADAFNVSAPYHLAINTGMNRIGVRFDEVVEFLRHVSFHRALDLVGTFTHFATADCAETLDFQIQARRFVEAIQAMADAGFDPGIVHASNSAAIFRYPAVHFDMVRLGIALYGLQPCDETRSLADLRPAMSVHARITDLRAVPMSEGVSYGLHYRSPGSVVICTLPIGYADGLRRELSGRADVILKGRRFRQVGNICMDQCMFEVDMRSSAMRARVEPQVGDQVTIVGREGESVITMDDMARTLGTITHEVAIGFGCSRMARVYK